MCLGT